MMRDFTSTVGLCCVAILFTAISSHAEALSGKPRVVDADTLAFGGEKVRIKGIDAPESQQW